MQNENIKPTEASAVSIATRDFLLEDANVVGAFTVTCTDADGNLRWEETFKNLVVNVGKADLLNKYFAGTSYTAAWYLGLVDGGTSPTYNAADTMASHAGWVENTGYSQATRPAAAFGAASASGGGAGSAGTGTIATSATAFSINSVVLPSGTIAGAFLTSNSTKSGTTGTLYSAGSFTTGNRTVLSGDTLNVTYTANC
jgi:hypothetical protein